MDPLSTCKLGRTEVELTRLGFGAAALGDLFTVVPDPDAQAAIDAAWDGGVRYFDTAPWYGRGQSEHRIGRGLYHRRRQDFVLSTKVGRVLRAAPDESSFNRGMWAGGLPFPHSFDYSYDGVMRAFEDSQQRLGMPRIDLLLIHDLDLQYHSTPARVTAQLTELATGGWRALSQLKDAGVIRGIGAGINERGMMARFLDLVDLDFFLVAMPYTLLDQAVLDDEFSACLARGVGVVIGAVFASGILATGAVPGAKYAYAEAGPDMLARVASLQAVCARHGVSLAAAALQFPFGHPAVASVIPGALSAEQVTRNLATFRETIPEQLWSELKHAGLLRDDAPVPA